MPKPKLFYRIVASIFKDHTAEELEDYANAINREREYHDLVIKMVDEIYDFSNKDDWKEFFSFLVDKYEKAKKRKLSWIDEAHNAAQTTEPKP